MGIPKNDGRRDARNPFTFMIERVEEDGSVIGEPLGGCNNVIGTQAMFRALLPHHNEDEMVRIRQGARIMSTENGTGEEHRKWMQRMYGQDRC
jgi:hypothetical protein